MSKLPLGSLVELEAVAYVGEMETEYVDMDVDETNSQLTPKYVLSDGNWTLISSNISWKIYVLYTSWEEISIYWSN